MSNASAVAHLAGLDYESNVVEFNVRPEPGTRSGHVAFKAKKGVHNLPVLDVQPDNLDTKAPNGQVYQWFLLAFPDGQQGWLRSHILTIQGDFTRFGYGIVSTPTYAYTLTRVIAAPAAPVPPAPSAPAPAAPAPSGTASSAPAPASPVPSTPAPSAPAPAAPVPSAPAPTPAVAPPPAPDPDAASQPGFVSAPAGARLRNAPVDGAEIVIMPSGAAITILEYRTISGQQFRWVHLNYQGQRGWTREDLVSAGSAAAPAPASPGTQPAGTTYTSSEMYPVPMKRYRFVRGFLGPLPQHNGVDYGGDTGEPVLTGPVGGLCVAAVECRNCNVPGKPSTVLQGLGLANPSVFSSPDWNFGYGHYIVVRYLHDQLPQPTRQTLANMGMPGAHVYVMHAHLSRMDVKPGTVLAPGQVIGACGDSGNSQGSHVHLEVRAGRSPNYTSWAALGSGLMDPLLMYKR